MTDIIRRILERFGAYRVQDAVRSIQDRLARWRHGDD